MRECFDSLYSRKYFRKFFFAGAAESYHTVMPLLPISGADAFLEESCETLDAHVSDVWKYICANAPSRRTVLYEHALINFAYDGCAYVLGERVYLTPKERRTYLENLLQAVDCGELELIILADNNPILPVSEISCSIYMNHTDMFSFCHNCSNDEVIFSSDELLLNAYRQFLRRLIDSNPQHLTGAALTDFIRRCAQQTME